MPRNLRWAVGLVCVLGLLAPSAASADLITTTLTDWSTVLPGLTNSFDANDPNICNAGRNSCVAAVLKQMDKRLAPLEASCSHNAMFSLLYDHITRQYYNTVVANPTFFNSNAFVNHEDAVFASYYFGAYDNYASGNLAAVPQAWQIAFNAAAAHQVTGTGNILLGVNAHIRRDLPFVLYRIGLTEPDGSNLKPDHDKVNQILDAAFADAINDASAHLDPSVNPNFPPALASWGFTTEFQAVEAWREEAYRNAEALASAPDDATRALISQQIEANAAASATAIRDSNLYAPTGTSATRDAYCAANQPVR